MRRTKATGASGHGARTSLTAATWIMLEVLRGRCWTSDSGAADACISISIASVGGGEQGGCNSSATASPPSSSRSSRRCTARSSAASDATVSAASVGPAAGSYWSTSGAPGL